MQTACNTPRTPQQPQPLPTPEEFDRLTAGQFQRATALDPTAAELLAMLDASTETQSLPSYPDTPEGHLATLLPENRARKLLGCKVGGFVFKYHDGHRAWRPSYPCQLCILCAACAADQADEQFAKYSNLASFMQGHHFTRVTVQLAPDAAPALAYDSLMRFLRKHLPKAPTVAKIKPSSDTVEVAYLAALSEDETALVHRQFPSAVVRRHCHSVFLRELHRVLDADTFPTPEATAAADTKYNGIHLLRVQGLSREERRNLSLMTPIRDKFSGDEPNAPDSTTPQAEKLYHRTASGKLMPIPSCPCGCGAAPTHFGRGKYEKDDSPDIHWIQIEAVTESQRIHEANLLKASMVMIQ